MEYYYFHFLFVSFFSAYLRAPCVPPIGPSHAQLFFREKTVVEELCRARKQEVGGQRSCTAQLARKEGKEVYFSREMEPTTAQKAVTPPVSNYGCDSDKSAT